MDSLVRFGGGDRLYTFAQDRQVSLRDNFRNVVPRTSRLPGLPGGFDEYGLAAAPAEIGNVQVVFWMEADTPQAIQTAKVALGSMKAWGAQKLYKLPVGTNEQRFCDARINSIEFSENARDVPHKRLRVEVNFQVANPVWLTTGTFGWLWGDGTTWGSGEVWGGNPDTQNLTGSVNTYSVTPGGNDVVYPVIRVEIPAGKSASDIIIQRLVGSTVVDQVRYNDTLSAGDLLEIDCLALAVKLNGSDAYNNMFSASSPAWFALVGGLSNTIRVLMTNPADEAQVRVYYFEAYNV